MDSPSSLPAGGSLVLPTAALGRSFELDGSGEAQQRVEHPVSASPREGQMQREGFLIGDLRLMIPYEHGNELTEFPPIYRLPNAPSWFTGVTNLHGTLVPVFDPAELLGVFHTPEAKPMLLVLGHGDERAGVVIDGLPRRLRPMPGQRLENYSVPSLLASCVEDVYRIDDLDWMDFRYAPLFERLEADLKR